MKHTPKTAAAAAITLFLAASTALTACTAPTKTSDGPPTPTASATTVPTAATLTCTDGYMLIDSDALGKKPTTVAEKCATTSVAGSGGRILLKGTGTLVVEGDRNTITVDPATTTLRLAGKGNTIAFTSPSAPAVDDEGTGNTVKKAG